jgi:hypothetical protein
MKFILTVIIFCLVGNSPPALDIGNEIVDSIRTGNARKLSKWFSSNVDLTVLGKEEMYSKAQAEQILRDFFLKYPPKSFNLRHNSSNPSATQYGIGSYLSMNGSVFRIYFLIRKIGNQSFIQQFSIESEPASH